MQLSDLFNTTVAQAIAWVLTSGILATLVGYALGWVPEQYAQIKTIATAVLVAMLTAGAVALASFVPESFGALKIIDALVVIIGAIAASIGGIKFGGLKAETHRVQQINVRAQIVSYVKRVGMILLMLGILVTSFALVAPSASAADPVKDYQYALSACSGFTVAEVQSYQQKFDTDYGFKHQLTATAQWVNSYNARANEFAVTLGCQPVIDANSNVTTWVKIYRGWFAFYNSAQPTPE